MTSSIHKHLFKIVDVMADKAAGDLERNGKRISCTRGCSFCCHLLVEISWEEAVELADWVEELPAARRTRILNNIVNNAKSARQLFDRSARTQRFLQPYRGRRTVPDHVYDKYFFDSRRPCPFLEASQCSAYHSRPTACRLHMVTSAPEICSNEVEDEADYHIPKRIVRLKDEAGPAIIAAEKDGRWGHLGIMVEAVLIERGLLPARQEDDPATVKQAG